MIDSPDEGFIYNPGTQPTESVGEQDDAIAGVRVLQIAGPYILGGMDTKWGSDEVDSYFVLDTRSGRHVALPTYDALRKSAQEAGVALKLEEIGTVYRRFRFTWFEVLVGILFAGPPILAFVFLARWVSRVRRTRETAFEPST